MLFKNKTNNIMRLKTPTLAVALCVAVTSIQFASCKKDNVSYQQLSQSYNSDAIADSASDSSLQKGLVAWYTFNGDVLDHSGYHNDIIFNSAFVAAGKSGLAKTAYRFDGMGSYMQVANATSLSQLKVSFYAVVKPTGFYQGTCHGNRILSKGYNDYSSGRLDLGFDDQAYYNYAGCDMPVKNKFENFYGSYGDGSNATGANDLSEYITKGEWYSIVYTYDGIYSKLYVNGVLVKKVTQSTTFNANTDPLFIGRNEDPTYPYYFKGVIDEIRIYKKVLNASQVLELYNNN